MSRPLIPQTAGSTTVYVVAGGNHVEIALDRSQSNELLDVIEVRAAPGGGPRPIVTRSPSGSACSRAS